MLVFDWIAGSCQVDYLKTGQDCSEAGEREPGLNFSPIQMFFTALFCIYDDYRNSKQEAKQYTESLTAKLQISNQNSIFFLGQLNWTLNKLTQELHF